MRNFRIQSPITALSRAALLLLAIGACNGTATGPGSDFAAARARWARMAPVAYTVTMYRSCECEPETSGPIVLTVSNGTVESRYYELSGEVVPPEIGQWFPTVEGLFALIDAELREGRPPLNAEYDPILGFPIRFFLVGTLTEGKGYTLRDFRPQ